MKCCFALSGETCRRLRRFSVFGARAGERPSNSWTFANQVLSFVTPGSLDARGIRQWNEAGRKVRKGSKAGFILIPVTRKIQEGRSANRGGLSNGPFPSVFKSCPIFGIESTEGETRHSPGLHSCRVIAVDERRRILECLRHVDPGPSLSVSRMVQARRAGNCACHGR